MRLRTAVGVSLVASLAIAATDKNPVLNVPLNIKVGLWQMTYTTEGSGATTVHVVPAKLLAKMSPEQRARTGARLRARASATQGLQVETRQYCMTEERLKRAVFGNPETGPACPRTWLISTAKVQEFREECGNGDTKRTVDGHFEALDLDTVKGSLKVKTARNNANSTSMDIAGRWLAADCGNEAR